MEEGIVARHVPESSKSTSCDDFKFLIAGFARLSNAPGRIVSQGFRYMHVHEAVPELSTNTHHPFSLSPNKVLHSRQPYFSHSPHHAHRNIVLQFPTYP